MMMEKLIFSVVFIVVFSMSLAAGLPIVVNAQENIIQENKNPKLVANFTKIFGEPFYKEISRPSKNSIVLSIEGGNIKTLDFYTAIGFLNGVGNVTEKSTFIATYQPDGSIIDTGNGTYNNRW
jgi:hypothetical protein